MRTKMSASWLPVCAFVAAVLLACLSNTRMAALGRAQAAPTCMVSATLVGIAGSATAWTIDLNSLRIDSSNNKRAQLEGRTTSSVTVDISGVDTNGVAFSFPALPTLITFTPAINKKYAPGTRIDQFAPLTCSAQTIFNDAKAQAKLQLGARKVRRWNPPGWLAQNVQVQVNGTITCIGEPTTVGIANGLTVTLAVTAAGNAPQAGTP